jgi:hypothetical protein
MSVFDQRTILQQELIEKALKDNAFCKALIANPKATLESEYGVTLPDALQIQVHQELPTLLHIVIPAVQTASETAADATLTGESSWQVWGHVMECMIECTQCSNNDTSCGPGPTEE